MQSLERYFYLIAFNSYLHEQVNIFVHMSENIFKPRKHLSIVTTLSRIWQYPLAFVSNFSQWMCCHAWLYRLLARMDLSELSASPKLVTRGARVMVRECRCRKFL